MHLFCHRLPPSHIGCVPLFSQAEMVYPGGELAFIMQMVDDSVRLGARIHWCAALERHNKQCSTGLLEAVTVCAWAQGFAG